MEIPGYEKLTETQKFRLEQNLASARIEGTEVSPLGQELIIRQMLGELSDDEAVQIILRHND